MEEITSKPSLQIKFWIKKIASDEDDFTQIQKVITKLNIPTHIITFIIN
jgi:hypothetical protein